MQLVGTIPELRKVPEAAARRALPEIARVVAEKAKELAPKRTGRLVRSIRGVVERASERAVVRATARHAHLVHSGVRPHVTRGRALPVATGPRGIVYRRSSRHPGTKGRPYLTDAVERSRGRIADILEEAGKHGFEEAIR